MGLSAGLIRFNTLYVCWICSVRTFEPGHLSFGRLVSERFFCGGQTSSEGKIHQPTGKVEDII
jgi:hypothetical protein